MEIIYATLQGIRKRSQEIQKHNDCAHLLSRGGYDLLKKKLLDEKRKKLEEEALLTENPGNIEDPPPYLQLKDMLSGRLLAPRLMTI